MGADRGLSKTGQKTWGHGAGGDHLEITWATLVEGLANEKEQLGKGRKKTRRGGAAFGGDCFGGEGTASLFSEHSQTKPSSGMKVYSNQRYKANYKFSHRLLAGNS